MDFRLVPKLVTLNGVMAIIIIIIKQEFSALSISKNRADKASFYIILPNSVAFLAHYLKVVDVGVLRLLLMWCVPGSGTSRRGCRQYPRKLN